MIQVTEHNRIYGTIHHPPMDDLGQVAEFHEIEIRPDDVEEFETSGYAYVRIDDYAALTLEKVEECTIGSRTDGPTHAG